MAQCKAHVNLKIQTLFPYRLARILAARGASGGSGGGGGGGSGNSTASSGSGGSGDSGDGREAAAFRRSTLSAYLQGELLLRSRRGGCLEG